jgi:hypothetical protein
MAIMVYYRGCVEGAGIEALQRFYDEIAPQPLLEPCSVCRTERYDAVIIGEERDARLPACS